MAAFTEGQESHRQLQFPYSLTLLPSLARYLVKPTPVPAT